jgi:hypothetical protein
MPTRILRDWTDSESVNQLSAQGERTFVRIIMKADDYGRLNANAKILRPLLYPFLLDQVREADLQRWIAECERAGLVRLYSVEGKQYMAVVKFGQRVRAERSKFPEPPPDDGQLSDRRQADVGPPRTESKSESKTKTPLPPGGEPAQDRKAFDEAFGCFWAAYPRKKAKGDAEKAWRKLKPSPGLLETMLAALERAQASPEWVKDGGQFIPYPATWLNGRRWEDEVDGIQVGASPLPNGRKLLDQVLEDRR